MSAERCQNCPGSFLALLQFFMTWQVLKPELTQQRFKNCFNAVYIADKHIQPEGTGYACQKHDKLALY